MTTTFNRSTQDDFGGMFGIAPNITSGTNRRIECMSRYSALGEDHEAIQNCDQLNMHLTNMYATRNTNSLTQGGDRYAWSLDYYDNQNYANRGGFDRYIWAGAFVEKSTGNVFTHTTINGVQTDGYMMIPSPYINFQGSDKTDNRDNMDSIRLKIKSNLSGGIPANTFVPLFGYAIRHGYSFLARENSAGTLYEPQITYRWRQNQRYNDSSTNTQNARRYPGGHSIPTAISYDTNNLYSFSSQNYTYSSYEPYQNDWQKNCIIWFMYAHDGNGNGMLCTCPGESAQTATQNVNTFYKLRPSNGHYGNQNGYFQWVEPYWYTEQLFQGASTLTDIWNSCSAGGDWYEALNWGSTQMSRTNFRRIWTHAVDRGDAFSITQDSVNWTNTSVTAGNHRWANHLGLQYGDRVGISTYSYSWNQSYCPSQIIAFGQTTNPTLSSETEIFVNFNTLVGTSHTANEAQYHLDHFGENINIPANGTTNANHDIGNTISMTGKILDFTFRDIPGMMYNDQWRFWHGSDTYDRTMLLGKPQRALVLRPSFEADMEVSDFSISNFSNTYPNQLIGGNTSYIQDYYRSNVNSQYIFGLGGFSYDPIADAKDNPGLLIEDPSSSWDNPENLINNDLTLRADLNAAGIENALYIKLSGTDRFPQGGVESDYEVNGFTLNIRGVTLSALNYHSLKFAIVDSTKQSTLFSTSESNPEAYHITEIPINNLTQSPAGDGSYHVYFQSSTSEPHYYSDISQGYLKIWAEETV